MGVRGIGRERESMSSTWVQFRVGQRSEPGCGRACGAAESGTLDTGGGHGWWREAKTLMRFNPVVSDSSISCAV